MKDNKNSTQKEHYFPLRWTDELVEDFWDYQSSMPEKYFTSIFGEQIAAAVAKHVGKGSHVVDYACGTGALTGHLLHAGLRVSSCDLSEKSVKYVQSKYSNQIFFEGAFLVSDLNVNKLKADAVVLVELIEHVEDEALKSILADAYSLLMPGGILVVTTPNDENLDIETVYCPKCRHTFHRWQHVRSWSASCLTKYLFECGFQTVSISETSFSLSSDQGIIDRFLYYLLGYFRRLLGRKQPHLIAVSKKI